MTPLADVARAMFAAAVGAVQPDALVRRLSFSSSGLSFGEEAVHPAGRLVLVALGKAGPSLAAEVMSRSRRVPDEVFVVTPQGSCVPDAVAGRVRFAGHPVPDERGERAASDLLDLLAGLDPSDGVLVLLSGGASACLAKPLAGVDRDRVAAVTRALLLGGASIGELNTVRKHLLAAAGGRLAASCPASMLTLVLSDVPGDDLSVVASGPTVADRSTCADARSVLDRYALLASFPTIAALLASAGQESPKPGDARLARARTVLWGSSSDALLAAAVAARKAGLAPSVLTRTLRGDARALGVVLGAAALSLGAGSGAALLLAGETTVEVSGTGRGGRNLELALSAARVLAESSERCVLAAGTDGVDGSSPAAGAVVDGGTLGRGLGAGRDVEAALADNDAWGYFSGLPDAIVTGPTGTNVADLVFVLASPGAQAFLADTAQARTELGASSMASRPAPPGPHGRLRR